MKKTKGFTLSVVIILGVLVLGSISGGYVFYKNQQSEESFSIALENLKEDEIQNNEVVVTDVIEEIPFIKTEFISPIRATSNYFTYTEGQVTLSGKFVYWQETSLGDDRGMVGFWPDKGQSLIVKEQSPIVFDGSISFNIFHVNDNYKNNHIEITNAELLKSLGDLPPTAPYDRSKTHYPNCRIIGRATIVMNHYSEYYERASAVISKVLSSNIDTYDDCDFKLNDETTSASDLDV